MSNGNNDDNSGCLLILLFCLAIGGCIKCDNDKRFQEKLIEIELNKQKN